MSNTVSLTPEAARNLRDQFLPKVRNGKYSHQDLLDLNPFAPGSLETKFLEALSIGSRTRQQIEDLIAIHAGEGANLRRTD